MAALVPIKAGGYAFEDEVTDVQMNLINDQIVKAPNFVDGGATYNLSAENEIGGAGLRFSGRVQVTSRTVVRRCTAGLLPLFDPSTWDIILPGRMAALATNSFADYVLHIPHGATLTKVEMDVFNPAHGGAWPPATPTRGTLYVVGNLTGPTSIATFDDSTAVQATYQSRHWAPSAALSRSIDRTTEVYILNMATETGANAIAGTEFFGLPRVTYTIDEIDED
jgi:hypothetical protein